MKHLFSVRHGDYNSFFLLSEYGKEQMETLADSIEKIIDSQTPLIVSSTAPRAMNSAELLAACFKSNDVKKEPYLWCANDAPHEPPTYRWEKDTKKLINILEKYKDAADTLIIVSHLGVAEDIVNEYFRRKDIDEYFYGIPKGKAIYIDIKKNRYQIIP